VNGSRLNAVARTNSGLGTVAIYRVLFSNRLRFASLDFQLVFMVLAIVITCSFVSTRREGWAQNGRKTSDLLKNGDELM
jgi:uncharacterized membrane protein YedE/YeeE